MENFIIIAILGGFCWLIAKGLQRDSSAIRNRRHEDQLTLSQQQMRARQHLQEQQKLRRINKLARNLQISLFQIDQAPDFQRAASWASKCAEGKVPARFRQRQFRRFRSKLIEHLARRLAERDSARHLMGSLRELVKHLAVSEFEADYMLQQVQQTNPSPTGNDVEHFEDQLVSLQGEHQQRMNVLRSLENVPDELREQLLEAEENRFHSQLFGGNPSAARPPGQL